MNRHVVIRVDPKAMSEDEAFSMANDLSRSHPGITYRVAVIVAEFHSRLVPVVDVKRFDDVTPSPPVPVLALPALALPASQTSKHYPGEVVIGVVSCIYIDGVNITLDDGVGFISIDDIECSGPLRLLKLFSIGQEIKAVVLSCSAEKIALGYKQ
jgi:hypothetical protein